MDLGTIIGFIILNILLVFGMGFNVAPFIDVPSMAIVIGGTFGSILVAYPLADFMKLPYIFKNTIVNKEQDIGLLINMLLRFSEKARREGLLALESDIESIDDDFLKKGIQLVVDGTDPELVKSILESEVNFVEERHLFGKGIMENFASLAPAYGMLGTLIGLILMLGNLADPSSLGPAMATALITTMYGSYMANAIFNPAAVKLSSYSAKEILGKNIIIEGVISIQAGDNPKVLEEKLKSFLSPAERAKIGEKEDR